MTESVVLTAASPDGSREEEVAVHFTTKPPHEVTAVRKGRSNRTYSGIHLSACLRKLRLELEEQDGLLLCCQGSRPDVTLSGMQAQMEDGRYLYTFDPASRTRRDEMVDIFAPAALSDVVPEAVQRAAVFAFLGIEDRGATNR
ncbi:hypothetical protein [Streptomyces sp. Ru87]|uniref:hypothetical protein n=1 Tax=Streptomyces sp. Ru87 TaxID=2044307 RepID=UPI00118118F2|nr:hypothetical protein [Streptomyces sp. Ru87]